MYLVVLTVYLINNYKIAQRDVWPKFRYKITNDTAFENISRIVHIKLTSWNKRFNP
jgi:hypothetical protein